MIRMISDISETTYQKLAKPLLFRQKPDKVHSNLLRVGGLVQKVPPLLWLLHAGWAYQNHKRLSQTVAGIHFANPIGLSAGFDKNFELVPLIKSVGFGLMEGGSITYERCDGNPRPWFYRLPKTKSLVVFVGLANHGAKTIVPRIKAYKPSSLKDFPLNISVAKTNSPTAAPEEDAITDYIGSLQLIKSADVGQMVTLNISCPNTYGGEPFTTPERLEHLLTAVDAVELEQPVFIKMPADLAWEQFEQLLAVADKHHITGVTVSNLAKDRTKMHLKDQLPEGLKGNMSGKPVQAYSDEMIARTRQTFGDRFVIIGVGGVFNAEDAYNKIRLGANLVELITGMIFEGPQRIGQINRDLVKLLERDGYDNVSQAVGASLKAQA